MKQNKLSNAVKFALTGVAFGALAACGGSGGSDSFTTTTSTGASTGAVTGFGSVYVNGVRFDTDSAELKSDDGIEREVQLEKGMILVVRGEWEGNEGRASLVEYDDTLRGPLTTATWDDVEKTGELSVIGQTVRLDSRTVFRGATPAELRDAGADTYIVRVSGWPLADGSFRASYIGARLSSSGDFDDLNEAEVEGQISGLDLQAQAFNINGLQVNYESAVSDDDFPLADLAEGLDVDVEGFIQNGVLMAEEIDIKRDDLFSDDDDVEFSGPVAADFNPETGQFTVNGITVQVTDSTEFDDGLSEAQDLTGGLFVSVEGEYRNGVVIADEIEAAEGEAELEGLVSAINRESRELTVGGARVVVTQSTLLADEDEDDSDTRERFKFEDFVEGDYLEVEGFQRTQEGGYLEAVKIEREEDSDTEFELEGRITSVSVSGDVITVMGLDLVGASNFEGLAEGLEVEVDYTFNTGGDYVIQSLEIESEDD